MTENANGARTLEAVLHPSRFEPFPGTDADALALAWEGKRPWVLASMAHAAYHDGARVEGKMRQLGAGFARAYDEGGAQAFLAVWTDRAVLAFRGTQIDERQRTDSDLVASVIRFLEEALAIDLPDDFGGWLANDVLADLLFRKKDFEGARVHRGFLGELRKLWPAIVPDLERHVGPGVRAFVTGHSLGAAMATLAGMLHPFAAVVTFGEPRVGRDIDRGFKAGGHTRYVNGLDPVTKVPPGGSLFRYEHHGDEVALADPDGPDVRFDHSIVDYAVKLDTAR